MHGIEELIDDIYTVGVKNARILKVTTGGKKTVSSFQYYIVGMAAMFIMYIAANGGQYSIDEINNGTYRRLIIANAGRLRFFVSRFIATVIFSMLQFFVLILYSILIFRISWGSPWGVAAVSFCLSAAIGGLSVLLSAINLRLGSAKASIVFQAAFIQAFALLGGSFFPVSGIPIIKRLGALTMNGAAMQGYLKLMMGYGPEELSGVLITLSGMALILFTAGMAFASATEEAKEC